VHLGRHPYHAGIAALAAGLLLAQAPAVAGLAAAAAVLALLAAGRAPVLGAAIGALLLLGSLAGEVRLSAIDAPSRSLAPGQRIEAPARLLERPRPSRFGSSAELELTAGRARGARLLARAPASLRWPDGGRPGAELEVGGLLERPRRSAGASFDYPAFLRRRGIRFELALEELRWLGGRRGGAGGAIDALRRRAERGISAGLSRKNAELLAGMVLGEDQNVSPEVSDDFRRSGLAHLLAVSGQNVMLLAVLALPLLSVAGLGVRGRLAGVGALVALYVPLAGAGPSLQRAGVMAGAGLAAAALGRPASRWYALLLAAAATLAVNPRVAGDPGWQLSFAAVGGIAALAPGLARALRALPHVLAEGIAITVAAALTTAPLLAFHFGAAQLVALPANLLALAAVAPVMWLGMLQAALGALGDAALPAAWALGRLNGLGLAYLRALARWFGDAPHGQLALPLRSPLAVAIAYALLAATALAARRVARALEPRALGWAAAWRRLPRRRRIGLVAGAMAVAGLGLWRATAPPGPPDRLTVSFLDVGQGDATLIQDGSGAAVLFDGGPPEARVARLVRNSGVKRLSAVVATHQSRDHQGGLPEVLERFPVDLMLDGGDGTHDPGFRALEREADRRGVRRVRALAGQTLRAGGLEIRVLSPPPRPPGAPRGDPNGRAVVAVVSEDGFRLFLSADAESPSLLPLRLPPVTAMKVPHHGSEDPGLPQLLRRLRPKVATIEVGAHNSYGHPMSSTLEALKGAVPQLYRTDRDGTVRLTVRAGRVSVHTSR
jgi:competence protein ComEC